MTNTNDAGAGSFRQALTDANAAAGVDTIAFNIGSGVQTISPGSMLPDITDPVIIDGTTQPGFAGTPVIVINGGGLSNVFPGIRITAGGSTVKGLAIGNFIGGPALALSTNGGNVVQGNYIGLDATGTQRRGNQFGLAVDTPNNIIGGTNPSQRNVISGSTFDNIGIGGAGSNNQIKGNYIGTNAAGTASLSGGSVSGIGIGNANNINNVIGGTEAGAGNLISGNSTYGISAGGDGTLIQGNLIGTDVSGTQSIPNGAGVRISASNVLLGGTAAAARNVISGNGGRGVLYSEGFFSAISKIQGNYIGVDSTGGTILIKQAAGIEVNGTVQIGGEPGAGNVISGNGFGIRLLSSGSFGPTRVEGNYIGTDATGNFVLGNRGGDGIQIGSSGNIIGSAGAGNVIGGARTGILVGVITSAVVENNTIQGNFIGVGKNGKPLGNLEDGIRLRGRNNKIGGRNPGEGNVIAFNPLDGVWLIALPDTSTGNTIVGNLIFRNGELGIDLGFDDVQANDNCDADNGVNDYQNYPAITSAVSANGVTNIAGNLNSNANSTFTIDFYASPTPSASGYGEGKIYLGSTQITTDAGCNAPVNWSLNARNVGNLFVSATATDAAGNTSEFSVAVRATGTSGKAPFDFDGDGKTDVSIFRPSAGEWWYLKSSTGGNTALQFGTATDRLAPGDYTGDGKADIAFWRPSTGFWFILRSEDTSFFSFPFGAAGDVPAPADYDGDGRTDAAVFRPSTATWFIRNSGAGGTTIVNFGAPGDVPVAADFDGDGRADIAIFRPSDGSWWYLRSSDNSFRVFSFGAGTDKPVAGDYTGDGRADIAVFRPSTGEWFFQRSEDNSYYSFVWGQSGDVPAPGDFDGDGKWDAAIFRPSSSTWYLNQTTAGVGIVTFGAAGDVPVPNAFVP